jgi:putative transcriptional regulator
MIRSVLKRKAGAKERTAFGLVLEESAKQILAHVKGEKTLRTRRVVLPDQVDVRRIRKAARMSQAEFACAFRINLRTLQEWEQGRRKPDATTRAYLAVIARNRAAVLEALEA